MTPPNQPPQYPPQYPPQPPQYAPQAPPVYGQPPPVYGAPPMGAYPPPYAPAPVYAMPPPQPGLNTFQALDRLKTGTMLAIIYSGLSAVSGLVLFAALSSTPAGATPQQIIANFAAVAIVGVLVGLIGLIAFIFGALGLYGLNEGKNEFGPEHEKSVKKGVMWLIYSILLGIAGGVGGALIGFALAPNIFAFDPAAFVRAQLISAAVGGVVSVITAFTLATSLESFLERLMTAKGRAKRQMFVLMSMVAAAVALALGIVGVLLFAPNIANPLSTATSASLAPLASIISVYSLYLYYQQVIDAKAGAQTMVNTGRYDPDGAPGMPPAPVAAAPMPMPPMPMPPPPPPV